MRMIRFLFLNSILLVLTAIHLTVAHGKTPAPEAKNGVLDLAHWNFSQDGPVDMAGEWKFFWDTHLPPSSPALSPDTMIQVPGSWNGLKIQDSSLTGTGFATFRLRVKGVDRSQKLGLKFLDMATAFTAYINGRQVFASGIPGKTQTETSPDYSPGVIFIPHQNQSTDQPPVNSKELDILIHVSNFHHWQGGMWESVTIGLVKDLNQIRGERLFIDAMLVSGILIMGIFHLFLYRFRRQDRSTLYFGLFCLMIAIRPMVHGERYITALLPGVLPFELLLQINYISFYFCVPLFGLYGQSLFPETVSKSAILFMAAVGGIASIITVMTPSLIFTAFMPYLQGATILAIGYGAVGLIKALMLKKNDAGIFILGFIFFALTIINDILYSRQIISTHHLVPLGLFFFILFQSVLLSKRFSRAFNQARTQQIKLTAQVAQRKKIESSLAHSEKRFRDTINFMPIPLCETNLDHNLTYTNKSARKWLGYSNTEANDLHLTGFVSKSDIKHILPASFTQVHISEYPSKEYQVLKKDKSFAWAQIESIPILAENSPKGWRICFVDLTERKKTQAALLQVAEQEKYALVGQVAGKIAHDFNNILGAIMGNSELSLMDCRETETRESLEIILEQTKRGQMLTQKLVAFAKDQYPKEEWFNINGKIDLVLPEFKPAPEIRGVSSKTILVVEDEDDISKVFKKLLTHPPFDNRVHIARDATEAAAFIEAQEGNSNTIDLISLDYMLPGNMTGLDVYHYIRENHRQVPVVFVSGNMEFIASIQELLAKDPYLDHLAKPCENTVYARTIEKWLT